MEDFLLQKLDPSLVKGGGGRSLRRFRKITIVQGVLKASGVGSSLVKIGATKVTAGITAQVGQPSEEGLTRGEIGVEVHLSPLCNPKYSSIQNQHEEGKAIETFVQNLLLKNNVIRREDLCIVEGRHVWKLNIDLVCLNQDGSLLDACVMAAVAALANVKLPATLVSKDDEGEVLIVPGADKELQLQRMLTPLTVGLFANEIICDLTAGEEERITNRITVVLDHNGQICALHKPGGSVITSAQLQGCVALCMQRIQECK